MGVLHAPLRMLQAYPGPVFVRAHAKALLEQPVQVAAPDADAPRQFGNAHGLAQRAAHQGDGARKVPAQARVALHRAQGVRGVAGLVHQHVGQALAGACPAAVPRQQLHRHVDGGGAAGAGDAVAVEAVDQFAAHRDAREGAAELGHVAPVQRHLVAAQQPGPRQQEAGVVDGHQRQSVAAGGPQHGRIGGGQGHGLFHRAAAEHHQVVERAPVHIGRRGVDLHAHAAAGGDGLRVDAQQRPGAVALAAAVRVVGRKAQLVQEAAERQQRELWQRQQQQAHVGPLRRRFVGGMRGHAGEKMSRSVAI